MNCLECPLGKSDILDAPPIRCSVSKNGRNLEDSCNLSVVNPKLIEVAYILCRKGEKRYGEAAREFKAMGRQTA